MFAAAELLLASGAMLRAENRFGHTAAMAADRHGYHLSRVSFFFFFPLRGLHGCLAHKKQSPSPGRTIGPWAYSLRRVLVGRAENHFGHTAAMAADRHG